MSLLIFCFIYYTIIMKIFKKKEEFPSIKYSIYNFCLTYTQQKKREETTHTDKETITNRRRKKKHSQK